MSEGTQNVGEEQAVVGEPASHPHQAVVVGEPPAAVAPVIGEPAFANGLQDQQRILPSSAEETAANGVQSEPHIPLHEEGWTSLTPSSTPVEESPESPNLQHVPSSEASESRIGEADTHQVEPPVPETPGLLASLVEEAPGASDGHVVRSTAAETSANVNAHDTVRSAEEEPADDCSADVDITHIVDSPSEAPPSFSEAPSETPYAAPMDEEGSSTEIGGIPADDTTFADRAPTSNTSSAPDEIALKGLGDQQDGASLSSAAQENQVVEKFSSIQTNTDDGALEGSEVVNESEQGGQGDVLAQDSDSKEANLGKEDTGLSVMEHALPPELDQASKRDALGQKGDCSLPDSEAITMDAVRSLSNEAYQSEASTVESSIPNKDFTSENRTAPFMSELPSNEGKLVETPSVDSSVESQGTRDMAVQDCLVNQSPAIEASFPSAANGNNGYQHGEDGPMEREQDFPKVDDDDDASAEVGKPSYRSKLPLIFTGLAIAAVGVAVASISRPR